MGTTKEQQAADAQKGNKEEPKRRISKTMEAALRLKGSLIVNDPAFLLHTQSLNQTEMEAIETQKVANAQTEKKEETKKTNKSWEAFGKSKGCFIINDPQFML